MDSNTTPYSSSEFNPAVHILRQDLIFAPPGAHLLFTLQDNKPFLVIQLPTIDNIYLCPVRPLGALLTSRLLPPLFANNFLPHKQVIDTQVIDALKKVLTPRNIPHKPWLPHI